MQVSLIINHKTVTVLGVLYSYMCMEKQPIHKLSLKERRKLSRLTIEQNEQDEQDFYDSGECCVEL